MPKQPPVPETDFLKLFPNHAESTAKLATVGAPAPEIFAYAQHVCGCWFKLAEEHLAEGGTIFAAGCPRAAYSRAYYAAYNASKAVRYIVNGWVSLRGDDHSKAVTLPDDFPTVAEWSEKIGTLYEHRLRADYENWSNTAPQNTLPIEDALKMASEFLDQARGYINGKFGAFL